MFRRTRRGQGRAVRRPQSGAQFEDRGRRARHVGRKSEILV